eukprot:COSAG06_NODE_59924_length_272_cov_1.323699_1_plen_56_part_01
MTWHQRIGAPRRECMARWTLRLSPSPSADWAPRQPTDELVPLVKKGDTLQEAGDLD